ncbi:MAG: hypothetical protein LBQ75_09255 [Zoogloeaceae bacterium]|jgi:hypothetical protein|nr:hypothetical protein [Zoogloeaceae bacterium]
MRRISVLAFVALLVFSACGDSPRLPNPVESKNGMSYIPIDDTAFLIPEKTWLTGFSRRSTDGSVGSISLHATIPDVQPWSKKRHVEMYGYGGMGGKRLEVMLSGDSAGHIERFYHVPNSLRSGRTAMIEELSVYAEQGLKKYRKDQYDARSEMWIEEPSEYAEQGLQKYREYRYNAQSGKLEPYMWTVFYEVVEDNRVKYFISCHEDHKRGSCSFDFPVSRTIMASGYVDHRHLKYIVSMFDKMSVKIQEFQSAGLAYRAAKARNSGDNP